MTHVRDVGGFTAAGVSSPAPGGTLSWSVYLQPHLNTPEAATQGLQDE